MAYVKKSYNNLAELAKAFADSLTELGVSLAANVEGTVNGQPSRLVIAQLAADCYVRYHFQYFQYNSRYKSKRNAFFTQTGTSVSNGELAGLKSPNIGDTASDSNSNAPGQRIPFPGILHVAKSDTDSDFVFCLENPADSTSQLHVATHTTFFDSTYGATKQWFTDGYYSGYGPYRGWNNPAFYNADYLGRHLSGMRQIRDGSDVVTGYAEMGNREYYQGSNYWGSGYQPFGGLGTVEPVKNDLAYDRSLTTIFLPVLWFASKPFSTSRTYAPRSEHPLLRICTMKHLAVAQQLTYNGKKWRVFPIYGKGGTVTPGIAFLEG